MNTIMGQAGPEDTTQLRAAQENYVHPDYTYFNPAYEQPPSAKPVWSLAKPLPRVLRPGMVPTWSETEQRITEPERPPRNVQKVGLEVDPADLEEGRIQSSLNPAKVSAQLKDSREQRENNFIQAVQQRRGTFTSRISGRPARASSQSSRVGPRGRATSAASRMTPVNGVNEPQQDQEAIDVGSQPSQDLTDYDQAETTSSTVPADRIPSRGDDVNQLDPIPEHREPSPPRRSTDSDTASQQTLHLEDEPDLYADMNDLKLVAENPPLYEEIHNHHTYWSIVRTQNREFLAELLAVFVQLTIGFSADTSATLNGTSANVNTTAWAWGFATMVGIYISGGISGAHLNPVVTVVLWFYRGFPKRKMIPYFAAQFIGALLAAYTAYGLYLASIKDYEKTGAYMDIANGFVTGHRHTFIDAATAFFNEFVSTAFLCCTVLALGDDQNAPPGAGMNALIIGLLITALNFAFAYQDGMAMNPSRDFGPRLALLSLGYGTDLFTNPFWFYGPWVGALCGAMVGAALYDVCIFTGGESPINYPWTRTKRSWKKGKRKWVRRARRVLPSKKRGVKALVDDEEVTPWPGMEMGDVS
ncbi:MIP transporter [Lecanosticta acicola]|uniref:MIP transporter n=1 Tax=Lecanosticta acicola TaxID=111012 RepID=A0AAI8Z251_9PEZI|nr:MIP transporter [Lecanosticta acicola]